MIATLKNTEQLNLLLEELLNTEITKVKEKIEEFFSCTILDGSNYLLETRMTLAYICYVCGKYEEPPKLLETVNASDIGDKFLEYQFNEIIAKSFHMCSNNIKANEYYINCLMIAHDLKDDYYLTTTYASLGLISVSILSFEQAIYYYEKAKIYCDEDWYFMLNIEYSLLFSLGMHGDLAFYIEKLEEFIEAKSDSLTIYHRCMALGFLSEMYIKLQSWKKVIEINEKILEIGQEVEYIKYSFRKGTRLYHMALAKFELGQYNESLDLSEKSIENFEAYNYKLLLEPAYSIKIKSYKKLGFNVKAAETIKYTRKKNICLYAVMNAQTSVILDAYVEKIYLQRDLIKKTRERDELENKKKRLLDKKQSYMQGVDKFGVLSTYALKISKLSTMEEIYELSNEYLKAIIGFHTFVIGYGKEGDEFIHFEYAFIEDYRRQEYTISFEDESFSSHVIKNNEKIIVGSEFDVINGARRYSKVEHRTGEESAIFVPLESGNEVFGLASVQHRESNYYTDIDVEVFESFVSILSGAISIVNKNQKLRQESETTISLMSELKNKNANLMNLSYKDSLTGLFNRTGFDNCIEQLLLSTAKPFSLAMVMIDIDKFKTFNDKYGHLMGDEYLKELAKLLTRKSDDISPVICRFGGEEFLMVAPYISLVDLLYIVEEIRTDVMHFKNNFDLDIRTSVSVGVCSGNIHDKTDVYNLIKKADELLYKAKRTGRNRICSEWNNDEIPRTEV